jgi:hypothetical protein
MAPRPLVLLAALAAAPAAAGAEGLEVGARAGLVLSSLAGDAIEGSGASTSTRAGATGALVARWPRGAWTFEGELGLSHRGAVVTPDGGDGVGVSLAAVDVALLAARAWRGERAVAPRLVAGLMPSLLVGAGSGADGAPAFALEDRVDVVLVLGGGIDWRWGGGTLLLDARLLGGTRDLTDDGAGSIRSNGFSLTAAFVY